jgi:hypothetical protein
LHYANFGVRKIAFRLAAGLPFPKPVWSQHIGIGERKWSKDAKGKGGIVSLNPFHEPDELEEIWEPGAYMEDVVRIRNLLAVGDLRVLYLLWLCAALDDQSVSPDVVAPPVPGGLADCDRSFEELLDFFGLDPLILVACLQLVIVLPPPPPRLWPGFDLLARGSLSRCVDSLVAHTPLDILGLFCLQGFEDSSMLMYGLSGSKPLLQEVCTQGTRRTLARPGRDSELRLERAR